MKGGAIVTGIGLVVTIVFAPIVVLVGSFAGFAVASVVRGPSLPDNILEQAMGEPTEFSGEPVRVPVQADITVENLSDETGEPATGKAEEPKAKTEKKSSRSASDAKPRSSSRSSKSRSSSSRSSSSRSRSEDLFAEPEPLPEPVIDEEPLDDELNIDDALEGFEIEMLDEEEDTKKKKKKKK